MRPCKQLRKFLGHMISEEGIRALPEKITSTLQIPKPTNVSEVKSFLRILGHYRSFLKTWPKRWELSTIC